MPSRWRRRWPVDWRACWVPAAAAETAAHADSDRWGGTGRAPRRCSVELALPLPPSLPSSLPPPPLLLPPRLSQPPPTAAGWGATCTRTPHGPVRACSLALSLCALLCALLSPVATLSALPVVISSVAVALRFIPQTFPPPPLRCWAFHGAPRSPLSLACFSLSTRPKRRTFTGTRTLKRRKTESKGRARAGAAHTPDVLDDPCLYRDGNSQTGLPRYTEQSLRRRTDWTRAAVPRKISNWPTNHKPLSQLPSLTGPFLFFLLHTHPCFSLYLCTRQQHVAAFAWGIAGTAQRASA